MALKGLADRTRLRILALLASGELCVCTLCDGLRLSQPTVSRHLAYLRRVGLVRTRKAGKWVHYRIAESAAPSVRDVLETVHHALTSLPIAAADRRRLRDTPRACDPDWEAPTTPLGDSRDASTRRGRARAVDSIAASRP